MLAVTAGRGWTCIQVRLLEGPPGSGDELADALLKHMLADWHAGDGHTLALQWLYRLWVAEARGGGDGGGGGGGGGGEEGAGGGAREGGAYERTLTALVAGLLTTLPYKDRALAKLLAAAPQVNPPAHSRLTDCAVRLHVESNPPAHRTVCVWLV